MMIRITSSNSLRFCALVLASTFPLGMLAQQPPPANVEAAEKDASVVVVLDASRAGRKSLGDMRRAVSIFVRSLDEEDEVALVAASDRPVLVQDFTNDETLVRKQLPKVKGRGDLALAEAIDFAADHAAHGSNNASPAVVVFASGADRQGVPSQDVEPMFQDEEGAPQQDADPALQDEESASEQGGQEGENEASAARTSIPVYVIASPKSDWKAQQELQQLASATGGTAFFPSSRSELRDVTRETAARVAGPVPEKEERRGRNRLAGMLQGYHTVLVRDIPVVQNKETQEAEGGENLLLHDVLVARLRKAKIFDEVVDAKDLPPSGASDVSSGSDGTAELLASILEYRRGNRTQRRLMGWKGGAKFKVRVIMVDAATREPIFSFVEEGSHSSGLFGGTQEHVQARAMLDVANEIVNELKRAKK